MSSETYNVEASWLATLARVDLYSSSMCSQSWSTSLAERSNFKSFGVHPVETKPLILRVQCARVLQKKLLCTQRALDAAALRKNMDQILTPV